MEIESNPVFPIDLSIFKDQIRQSFLSILNKLPKVEKTLVLEKSFVSKLNYLTSRENLKELQIRKDLIMLNSSSFRSDSPIIIYIITPNEENVKIIEKHIETNMKDFESKNSGELNDKEKDSDKYHIIFIPKISGECYHFINNSKYKKYFNTHILNIDIYQLDNEILSLENHNAFRDIYLENNLNSISQLSRAIIKYETVFGKIKHKYSKGFFSKKLIEMLNREEEESNNLNNLNTENETLACFIFDRNIDMITPMCTNWVYEGVLDEFIGIDFDTMVVDSKILEKESKTSTVKIDLSSKDKFYSTVKDFNLGKIRSIFPERMAELNKENNEKLTKEKKTEKNLLNNHINILEYINKKQLKPIYKYYYNYEKSLLKGESSNKLFDFIDDEMSKKADKYNLLRILCLECAIHSGIKNKFLEQIKKDFLNIYGYEYLFLLRNLEKVGMLKVLDSQNFYTDANKKLQLIFGNVNLNEPNDTSYAYIGYSPIIIRLIEKGIAPGGWGNIKDVLKKIPGDSNFPTDESDIFSNNMDKQFILVVFIGGITYGELAGIRLLNKKNRNKKFIVITTGIINSKKIFNIIYNYKITKIFNNLILLFKN
jgi:hypothetical protein